MKFKIKMNLIKENDKILFLWGGNMIGDIESQVNEIKNIKNVTVNVENVERLGLGKSWP